MTVCFSVVSTRWSSTIETTTPELMKFLAEYGIDNLRLNNFYTALQAYDIRGRDIEYACVDVRVVVAIDSEGGNLAM